MEFTAVDPQKHRKQRLLPLTSFAFARDMAVIPLYAAELANAAIEMPIAFVKEADGSFTPVALVSTDPGNNFYVGHDGRWLANYVPALLRRHPFGLAKHPEKDDMVLCIDEGSSRLSETEGQALFQEDGQPTELLAGIIKFLQELEESRRLITTACAALAGVIVPWELTVRKEAGASRRAGLFKVDEAKLNSVEDDCFLKLRRAGALPLAYAHLISLGKLPLLGQLGAAHDKASQRPVATQPLQPSVESLFGQAGGETIKFNF